MKKITLLFVMIFLPLFVFAQWDDCVHGEENCEYPGECGDYVDTNNDKICDHSQPEPALIVKESEKNIPIPELYAEAEIEEEHSPVTGEELKTMTVEEVARAYEIDADEYAVALSKQYKITIKSEDSFQTLHDNAGVRPNDAKNIAENLVVGVSVEKIITSEENVPESEKKNSRGYHLISITLVLFILYFITWFLAKKEKITLITHRKIWNMFLLIAFLLSGISGILLVIRINYGLAMNFPMNLLKFHVETGIAMAIITIFHIAWHRKYFKFIFKKQKVSNASTR